MQFTHILKPLGFTLILSCSATGHLSAQTADSTGVPKDSAQTVLADPSNDAGSFTIFGHHMQWPGVFHHHPDSVKHHHAFWHNLDSTIAGWFHSGRHLLKHHSGLYRVKMKNRNIRELFDDISNDAGISFTYVGNVDINTNVDIESFSINYLVDEIAYQNGMLAVKEQGRYIIYGDNAEAIVKDQTIIYTYSPRNLDYKTVKSQASNLGIKATIYELENQNALLLKGTLADIKDAITKFRIVDDLPRRVSIELLIVEYNHGEQFNWDFDVTSGQAGRISDGQYNPQAGAGGFTYSFLGQLTPEFKVNLRALVAKNYANVVTNPHIVTTNNEKATIDITERRYVQLETASINGITTNLQNIDAGIKLDVTPLIMNNGNVKLTIDGNSSVFLVDENNPSINTLTNAINTQVTMENGETLIIGGLIQADEADGRSGIPVLRRIPILNLFFGGFVKEKNYLETVIYITVYMDPLRNEVLHKSTEEYRRLERRLKSEDKNLNIRGVRKVF